MISLEIILSCCQQTCEVLLTVFYIVGISPRPAHILNRDFRFAKHNIKLTTASKHNLHLYFVLVYGKIYKVNFNRTLCIFMIYLYINT